MDKYTTILALDIDDCIIESSRYIQKYLNDYGLKLKAEGKHPDEYEFLLTEVLSAAQHEISCLERAYEDIKAECENAEAFLRAPAPYVGKSFFANSDIFKEDGSLLTDSDIHYIEYRYPVECAKKALDRAKKRYDDLLEARDNFLEEDNAKLDGYVVDYDAIYRFDNIKPGVHHAIYEILTSGKVDYIIFATHHNGVRELIAKRNLCDTYFQDIPFFGQRFHETAHVKDCPHRLRSEKAKIGIIYLDILKLSINDPNVKVFLLDDSLVNSTVWAERFGQTLWYHPVQWTETYLKTEVTVPEKVTRVINFDANEILNSMASVLEKQRIMEKRGE